MKSHTFIIYSSVGRKSDVGLAGLKRGVRGLVLSGAPETLRLSLGRSQPLGPRVPGPVTTCPIFSISSIGALWLSMSQVSRLET